MVSLCSLTHQRVSSLVLYNTHIHTQESTLLWECLPAVVMDQVLTIHHDIMRETRVACKGFESATEVGRRREAKVGKGGGASWAFMCGELSKSEEGRGRAYKYRKQPFPQGVKVIRARPCG